MSTSQSMDVVGCFQFSCPTCIPLYLYRALSTVSTAAVGTIVGTGTVGTVVLFDDLLLDGLLGRQPGDMALAFGGAASSPRGGGGVRGFESWLLHTSAGSHKIREEATRKLMHDGIMAMENA